MPFLIVRDDITHMRVDAIVAPGNTALAGGGGTDGAIRAAAGPELEEACRRLDGCPVGESRVTPGFRLPSRWVIHTVGPVWQGGDAGEEQLLRACYRGALVRAQALGCESLAFPLISAGTHGFPKEQALQTAEEEIRTFLQHSDMRVYLVIYGRETLALSRSRFDEIREYIDDNYVREHPSGSERRERRNGPRPGTARRRQQERREREREETEAALQFSVEESEPEDLGSAYWPDLGEDDHFGSFSQIAPEALGPTFSGAGTSHAAETEPSPAPAAPAPAPAAAAPRPAAQARRAFRPAAPAAHASDWVFGELDESFQQMLLRKIDEQGITDAECYKRANIDRKLFSKIRKDPLYKPSKPTALAFAVALRLDEGETEELLEKAGFALSRSSRFDMIVRYHIERRIYDIYAINEALFAFDQALLGNMT